MGSESCKEGAYDNPAEAINAIINNNFNLCKLRRWAERELEPVIDDVDFNSLWKRIKKETKIFDDDDA